MAKKPEDDSTRQNLEAEVWSAISAFEQILEALPNDRASLEALWNAYEQIGDYTKANGYLTRLANAIADEADEAAAAEIVEKLRAHAEEDSSAKEALARLEQLAQQARPSAVASERQQQTKAAVPSERVRATFSMADELAFAWNLLEAGQLTQEEYASVVQDLTEMSAVESATTVSVLHVLESRAFKNLEKIMVYVSKECGAPIISLGNFDFKPDEIALLPQDFMMGRGVFVFDLVGKEPLVVVMNAYDKQLRKDVESLIGAKCHFFMTLPSEFDKALANLTKQLSGKTADAAQK